MNYLDIMSHGWTLREQGLLSAREHDLYMYLINKSYSLKGKNPLEQPTQIVCAVLGINRNGLAIYRSKLQMLGLIAFRRGLTKGKPALYELKYLARNLDENNPSIEKYQAFVKPSINQIESYCRERGNGVSAKHFYDYYESKNWMIGKNKMSNWQAAIRTWENKQKEYQHNFANYDNKKKHIRF